LELPEGVDAINLTVLLSNLRPWWLQRGQNLWVEFSRPAAARSDTGSGL
jgi:hypothetical protein